MFRSKNNVLFSGSFLIPGGGNVKPHPHDNLNLQILTIFETE
jgi:hypothetical protein